MESILLTLALIACAEDPSNCSVTQSPRGMQYVSVCNFFPKESENMDPANWSFMFMQFGNVYYVTIESHCNEA